MQDVRRKHAREHRHARLLWLLLACFLLALLLIGWLVLRQEVGKDFVLPETHAETAEVLMSHESEEVARVAVTLRTGIGWVVQQTSPGELTLEDAPEASVSAGYAANILSAVRTISCEAVLTDDPRIYRDDLAAFGLETPRLIAEIRYTDGENVTLRVGDVVSEDDKAWFYMTIDGDDRLFAINKGTVDDLTVDRGLLHPVTQPVLHAARFDHITLTGAEGTIIGEWALAGDIGDADAGDRWHLVAPLSYPADSDAVSSLKANLAALRLGAYVCPATPENLMAYGFDAPRLIIDIHQAEGSFGTTSLTGEYSLTDWPESDFTLVVGGAQNEDIDYVRYEDTIYTGSHYLLAVYMGQDCLDSLSRYIAPTALGNLARLSIETAESVDTYEITRTEQVAENNDLVTDGNGQVVYDYTCARNGEPVDYEAFAAAYARLIVATVSGRLPENWIIVDAPHTVFTFDDVSGETHTVAFATFDALHDAVLIDGEAVFYLIKGGFKLTF